MISILETTIRIEAGAEFMYDFKSVLCARACRLPDVVLLFLCLFKILTPLTMYLSSRRERYARVRDIEYWCGQDPKITSVLPYFRSLSTV
jgi:hypothetical protein